ncbi:hypothetical protein FJZ31_41740, partial [Candidatus Poribacteria bacterium]|nr:hypothetical protein [Candidatus Poribacteria bacterium]
MTVLRFTNQEVAHQKEGVLDKIVETLRQVEPSEDHYKQWRRADSLQVGDVVYFGPEQRPVEITGLFIEQTEEEVYDLEVEGVHSFLAEVCAVHNCGSGTTAYVAEQWGRRWITCDTSRVALALARQRLLTATYPYYKLTDETRGVAGGFIYQTVPHITLKSIAQIEPPQTETLFDQPEEDKKKVRVPGPFTVEAIPPPSQEVMEGSPIGGAPEALERTDSEDDKGRTTHIGTLIELLRKDGVTFPNNQKMMFASFTARSGGVLHAEGEPGPPPLTPPSTGGNG